MADEPQQVVVIEWVDSAMHGTAQRSREEAKRECGLIKCVSAGMLVHEDDQQITIALDWFPEDDDFRQIASYPKSGITNVTRRHLVPEDERWQTREP